MPNAHGSAKQVRYKKESAWAVAPGTGGAQLLRRVTRVPNLKKTISESDELASHRQRTGTRHGMRSVEDAFAGKLSPGTYKDFLAALVRRAFTAVTAISGMTIAIAGAGPTYTVTRSAGSWLTDGIKFGQSGRLTAGAFNAANLNKNLAVVSLTASALTVLPLNGAALVAEAGITAATWTPTGKVTFAPASGFTDDSFAIEDWHSDTSQSELYLGEKLNEMAFSVPSDGNVDVTMNFMGRDVQTATAAYYVTPAAETTTPICHSSSGVIVAPSGALAIVTAFSLSVKGNMAPEPASGSSLYSAIDPGRILVDGSLSAYMPDGTLRDYFLNETLVSLVGVFGGSQLAAADFVGFTLPTLKLSSADKDDGDKPVIRNFSFAAEYNSTGGAGQSQEQTSIYIQDSQA